MKPTLTPDKKGFVIQAKNPHAVVSSIPGAILGENNLVTVPMTHQNAMICAQFGEGYVNPVLLIERFHGIFQPMRHQYKMINCLTSNQRFYCLADMGTGKTAAAIWAAEYLITIGAIKRVLVVCPKTIMRPAWGEDLFKTVTHRPYVILHNTNPRKREALAKGTEPWHIINHDGVKIVNEILQANQYDLIIIDESRAYATASTDRWKALAKLIKPTTWVWALTGTPVPNGPEDAHGQVLLLTPQNMPRSLRTWKERTMIKVTDFRWVPRANAMQLVHQAMQPGIVIKKRDVLKDLPPVTVSYREIPLSQMQLAYYEALRKDQVIQGNVTITAVNAGVMMIKLMQIASGALYLENGQQVEFDVKARLAEAVDIINESEGAVLLFVPFRHTLDLIARHLYTCGISTEIIHGGISSNERSRILSGLQSGSVRVICAVPDAMAHGVTATEASTTIWFAPPLKTEIYLQANNRMDRPGQKRHMHIIHLYGSKVERDQYNNLQGNISEQNGLLDLYKNFMRGEYR